MSFLRLPPLPTTRELIRLFGLSAKQQLSQNFLLDLNITDKIVRSAGNIRNATVLEVGPGPGSLTRSIINAGVKRLTVVEKDHRFLPALETIKNAVPENKLTINHNDILAVDERQLLKAVEAQSVPWPEDPLVKIIGNLPFGIATELTLKWIRQIPKREGPFAYGRVPMVLLFQKEVAMRIAARPGTKTYGRLSVMVQRLCHAKPLFDIDGKAFVPPPKVTATAIWIQPRIDPLADVDSMEDLEYVCRQVFGQRRKTLENSIQTIGVGAEVLIHNANLPAKARAEDLTIEQWCALSRAYTRFKARKAANPEDNGLEPRPAPPAPDFSRPKSLDDDPFYKAFEALAHDKENKKQLDRKITQKKKDSKKARNKRRRYSAGFRARAGIKSGATKKSKK